MYMIIRSDLQVRNSKSFLFRNVMHQLLEVSFYVTVKNSVSAFCPPHNMVVQIIHRCSTMCKPFIVSFHALIILYPHYHM